MATQNQQNQDETAIDKMNAHLTGAGEKIANNKQIIIWSVGAIVVVAALIMGYLFMYRAPRIEKSYEDYNKVAISSMGLDSIAAEQYKAVSEHYGTTGGGNLAALSAGEALYGEGKYEEAVKYLQKFSSKDPVLNANAQVLVGDCYVNLEKYDDAIDAYNKAVRKADGNPQIVPRVLLKEANVYDAQGKYDKALDCYMSIKKDFPEFQLGNGIDIDAYIARENARLGK